MSPCSNSPPTWLSLSCKCACGCRLRACRIGFWVPVSIVCSTRVEQPMSKVPVEKMSLYSLSKSSTCCHCSAITSGGNLLITGSVIAKTGSALQAFCVAVFRVGPPSSMLLTATGHPSNVPAASIWGLLVVLTTHTLRQRSAVGSKVRPTYNPDPNWRVSIITSSAGVFIDSRVVRAGTSTWDRGDPCNGSCTIIRRHLMCPLRVRVTAGCSFFLKLRYQSPIHND